jgi:hypothetical protein
MKNMIIDRERPSKYVWSFVNLGIDKLGIEESSETWLSQMCKLLKHLRMFCGIFLNVMWEIPEC